MSRRGYAWALAYFYALGVMDASSVGDVSLGVNSMEDVDAFARLYQEEADRQGSVPSISVQSAFGEWRCTGAVVPVGEG